MEIQAKAKVHNKSCSGNQEQCPQAGIGRATGTFMVGVLYSLRKKKWKCIFNKEWLWIEKNSILNPSQTPNGTNVRLRSVEI